mmetsp:Transcript_111170/g.166523  ORF Transcript_111170/g.166523 Transcript_111170/m.166523 type:complete len:102 (+) Transcript_111170:52-357(+)
MDIYELDSHLKFVNQIGVTLNIEEKLKLKLALLKLSESEKCDEMKFWGKIEGTAKDYYICCTLVFKGKFEFPTKKFFYASNEFIFAALPEINPEHKEKADA